MCLLINGFVRVPAHCMFRNRASFEISLVSKNAYLQLYVHLQQESSSKKVSLSGVPHGPPSISGVVPHGPR